MKVLLITMPWSSLQRPSLALSILSATVNRTEKHLAEVIYGNIQWAEYLNRHAGLDSEVYETIADGYFVGAGEWIFTNALYNEKTYLLNEFMEFADKSNVNTSFLAGMHTLAPNFIDELAKAVAEMDHEVIGMSTTFLQNISSLALAKKIKAIAPEKIIVFGGGNVEGTQGEALHRNFPFVDFVVRGEGEISFVKLLDSLEDDMGLRVIPGLCWRDEVGNTICNDETNMPVHMDDSPSPDYSEYFDVINKSSISSWIDPRLIVESSRGCWWGAKHQCAFCGLNGQLIGYRVKSFEKFLSELQHNISSYRVLDIFLADNIIDMKYFSTLLPRLAELDWDLRIFCEIKANISHEQVKLLSKAGVVQVQPGIESLSSSILKLMKKGVTGVQNIRLLRNCQSEGVTVSWNYLYGFPYEKEDEYIYIMSQMPNLVHLQPPDAAYRVALERFSPYFEDASLGLVNKGAAELYKYIYNLPEKEILDLVYLFESETSGLKGELEKRFLTAVESWRQSHVGSTLKYKLDSSGVILIERRDGKEHSDYTLPYGGAAEAYLALMDGRTMAGLRRDLQGKLDINEEKINLWLSDWVQRGFVFLENETYIALATCLEVGNIRFPVEMGEVV